MKGSDWLTASVPFSFQGLHIFTQREQTTRGYRH